MAHEYGSKPKKSPSSGSSSKAKSGNKSPGGGYYRPMNSYKKGHEY